MNNLLHVACNYHYLGWVLTWKYLKQGFWGKILVLGEKSPILRIVSCLCNNFSKQAYIWIIFFMLLVIIIILDGFLHGNIWRKVLWENLSFWFYMEIFEARVLEENLRFWFYMEIFEARVLEENLRFWLKYHQFWE